MQYTIDGELAQVANLSLDKGDTCWASKGSIVAMDPGLGWHLKVPGGASGAARRMMSGEGVALTFLEASADGQWATLAANQPGKIIAWNLDDGPVITTRGSFVAAFGPRVEIDVRVAKRAGAAFFGGAGLFLQHIKGSGTVLVHGSGDFIERDLGRGEAVLVSTGSLAAFAESVDYDIQGVAGCRRMAFGGEGLFMTRLAGPGLVLLQSLKRVTPGPKRGPRS
ncbi:MAG: AIM24 family protein [Acidobacteriota bacterium]|nr:AIM24 family protein [Acidobacteriota bacterium]